MTTEYHNNTFCYLNGLNGSHYSLCFPDFPDLSIIPVFTVTQIHRFSVIGCDFSWFHVAQYNSGVFFFFYFFLIYCQSYIVIIL